MASPKEVLSKGVSGLQKKQEETVESRMAELVEKVFTTRNLLHFAHLSTKSFAQHLALGDMYDSIIDKVDEICEVYMGKFGLLSDLEQDCAKMPSDIISYIKAEASWVDDNRMFISRGYKPVDNLIDGLLAEYDRTIYKLENLK